MDTLLIISAAIAIGLLAYLTYVMLFPESFA